MPAHRTPALRRLAGTTLTALVAVLAGCGDGGGGVPSAPLPRGDAAAYVAIGDSYTAAPSVGDDVGDPGCRQTTANYPRRVAAALEVSLVDASCGGATTRHLTEPQGGHAPQLDALGPGTELVTYSLGINDHRLFGRMLACIDLGPEDVDPDPCERSFGTTRAAQDKHLDRDRERLIDAAFDGLAAVAERAPNARILVVGYPQIAPADVACAQFPVAANEVPLTHRINRTVNDALATAATRQGLDYVDLFAATQGHDICAEDPWIAGGEPTAPAFPYHPYATEQQVAAEQVLAALR
ncbi:SGNH/GDSL hydrolase family protein [Nocardioides sambongensis]|uniref:SGNH/GDSL hydrolase family protein n=1 Tax=Nocardioides sambongensis TaxID=2589074 RepID=UPI0011297AB7|nr:SGNH/GDSL hydrolase family protein [Nocardioides sambongensis]